MNFDPVWYRELLMDWRASIIPRIGRFHRIYKSTFEEVVFNPDTENSLDDRDTDDPFEIN